MNFQKLEYTASYGTFAQLPKSNLPEIAFSGRSNVGKSSLINKVFTKKALARVSSRPGKTVTINFYEADGAWMVDLPGYGYAKTSNQEKKRWAELMEGYFHSDRNIPLVVQLLDMRHKPTADDVTMLSFLQQTGYDFVVALTKSDKLNKTEYKACLAQMQEALPFLSPDKIIPFSAKNGDGVYALLKSIEQYL